MRASGAGGALAPTSTADLAQALADYGVAEGIYWELEPLRDSEGRDLAPMDSSSLRPSHWSAMALAIQQRYHEFDGFVVLHGTDTLAYTASALSFLLVNLAKPVVLTGSQLPVFSVRTDARQNLINALYIAGYQATGLPRVCEVSVCFGDVLLRGNRTRKVSTSAWQGFASPNYPRLGTLGETIRIFPEVLRPAPKPDAAFFVESGLVDEVLDLTLFPGIRAQTVTTLLENKALRGLVLRAYGSGNAPGDEGLMQALSRAGECGTTVLIVTQCNEGRVDLGHYEASRVLVESGVATGFDLTPEAALTKLMWMLGREQGADIRRQLQIDQRGEQSYNLLEIRFGPAGKKTAPLELSLSTAPNAAGLKGKRLERARLAISGVQFTGLRKAESFALSVYIGTSGVDKHTPRSDIRCLAEWSGQWGGQPLNWTADVTAPVLRLLDPDRPVHITVVARGEYRFWFRQLSLDLITLA